MVMMVMEISKEGPIARVAPSESSEARQERRKERRRHRKSKSEEVKSGKRDSISTNSLGEDSKGSTTCSSISSEQSDLRDSKGRLDASTGSEGSSKSFPVPRNTNKSETSDKEFKKGGYQPGHNVTRIPSREEENMKDLMAILASADGEIEIETKQGPGPPMKPNSFTSTGSSDSREDRSLSSTRRSTRRSVRGKSSAMVVSDDKDAGSVGSSGSRRSASSKRSASSRRSKSRRRRARASRRTDDSDNVSVGSAGSRRSASSKRSASSRRSKSRRRRSMASRKTDDKQVPQEGKVDIVVSRSCRTSTQSTDNGRSNSGKSTGRRSMMHRQSSVPTLPSYSDDVQPDSAVPGTSTRGGANSRRPSNSTRSQSGPGQNRRGLMQRRLSVPALSSQSDHLPKNESSSNVAQSHSGLSQNRRALMQRQSSVPSMSSRSEFIPKTQGLRMDIVPSNRGAPVPPRRTSSKRSSHGARSTIPKQSSGAPLRSRSDHASTSRKQLSYKQHQQPQKFDKCGDAGDVTLGKGRRPGSRPALLRRQASVPELSARTKLDNHLAVQQPSLTERTNPMNSFLGSLFSPVKSKSMTSLHGSMPALHFNLEQDMDDEILSMADEPTSSTAEFRKPVSARGLSQKEEQFVGMLEQMEKSVSNIAATTILEESLRQLDQVAMESQSRINVRDVEDDSMPSLVTNQSSPVSNSASKVQNLSKEEQLYVTMLQQAEKSMSNLPDTPVMERSLLQLPTSSPRKASSTGTEPTEDSLISDEGKSFASMPSLV